MPYMECIEIWRGLCECGETVAFPVEETKENNKYECKCGRRYIIDRAAGHFHEIEAKGTAQIMKDNK